MQSIRKKTEFFKKQQRQQLRQELIENKRIWEKQPSIIVAIPSLVDREEWEDVEMLLDGIGERDVALVENNLRNFVREKYQKAKHDDEKKLSYFNLLRIMNRIKMWSEQETAQALSILFENYIQGMNNASWLCYERCLKMLKEVAIHAEALKGGENDFNSVFGQRNVEIVKQKLPQMKIATKAGIGNELLENYLLYYACLISLPQWNIADLYTQKANLSELLSVIYNCLQSPSFPLNYKAIELILCLLNSNKIKQQNSKLPRAIQLLLLEEKSAFSDFLGEQYIVKQYQTKTSLLPKLFSLLNKGQIQTTLLVLQMLASLFDMSDKLIRQFLVYHCENMVQCTKDPTIINRKQLSNFSEHLCELTQHLFREVRLKTYWLISNITGSQQHYQTFGMPLLQHIYANDLLTKQASDQNMCNEIHICVLNYACNWKSASDVTELLSTKGNIDQESGFVGWIIDIVTETLKNYHAAYSKRQSSQSHEQFSQRLFYCIYNIIKISDEHQKIRFLIHNLQSQKVKPLIEDVLQQGKGSIIERPSLGFLESILNILEKHNE